MARPDDPPADGSPPEDEKLVEGVDYYVEDGYVVMTAHYLEKRGWCCRNGCRHCPYGFDGEDATNARPAGDPPGQGRLF